MNQKETKVISKPKNSQQIDNNDENNCETELSTTLVERRKRLHILANEINNWEDESTVHKT
jgi:hypothetical protein